MCQLQAKPDLTIAGVLPCCIKVLWRREFCAFALSHIEYVQGGPVDRVSNTLRPTTTKKQSAPQHGNVRAITPLQVGSGISVVQLPPPESRLHKRSRLCQVLADVVGSKATVERVFCRTEAGNDRLFAFVVHGVRGVIGLRPGDPVDLYRAVYQSLLTRRSRSCATRRPPSRSQYISALSCCIANLRRRDVIHFT